MSNDVIFYTQVVSIVFFILALFGIYRSLVAQKDGVIELLRKNLKQMKKESKIFNLKLLMLLQMHYQTELMF